VHEVGAMHVSIMSHGQQNEIPRRMYARSLWSLVERPCAPRPYRRCCASDGGSTPLLTARAVAAGPSSRFLERALHPGHRSRSSGAFSRS
jgi:hypothetical protein